MTRLASALRLELTLQVRQRFLHAAVFSGLIWLAVLLPLSRSLRPVAEPYILPGDTCIIGFFFVAGTVFFEKQERTLGAVISTPLRFWEYLAAKLTLLVMISLFVAVVVPVVSHGLGFKLLPLLLFGEAFHQVSLEPWQVLYAVAYPSLWWLAKAMFVRYVVAQSGGM